MQRQRPPSPQRKHKIAEVISASPLYNHTCLYPRTVQYPPFNLDRGHVLHHGGVCKVGSHSIATELATLASNHLTYSSISITTIRYRIWGHSTRLLLWFAPPSSSLAHSWPIWIKDKQRPYGHNYTIVATNFLDNNLQWQLNYGYNCRACGMNLTGTQQD